MCMVRHTKSETKVSANDQPTAGNHKHPIQEAAEAERRLISRAAEEFDEFQILRFRATNVAAFPFEWALWNRPRRNTALCLSAFRASMTVAFRSVYFQALWR